MMPPVPFLFIAIHAAAAVGVKRRMPSRFTPRRSRGSIANGLNSSAVELFERSRRSYESTYGYYGRAPATVEDDALTLDFEIETCAAVELTPELLLQRAGVDIDIAAKSSKRTPLIQDRESSTRKNGASDTESTGLVWPKVSKWFTVGIDGTGRFINQRKGQHMSLASRSTGTYRQDLSGQLELESQLMRPKDVIKSNFTAELQSVMDRLSDAKSSRDLLNRQNANNTSWQKQAWYTLPFEKEGAKGINIRGGTSSTAPCTKCHVQWTPGLPLRHVPTLLRMSDNAQLHNILGRTDALCAHRCSPDYRAFVSLAAMAVVSARMNTECGHPKRYMVPFLVRTHFGDLAMMIKEKYGAKALEHMAADVMHVGQLEPDMAILPNDTIDYLKLPEMAELSGMVYPRNPLLRPARSVTEEDMPTDSAGLLALAEKMIRNQRLIATRLHARACRLHSRSNIDATKFKVKDWLDGLQHGKDLMSDHDSPLSQSSFSHMVWKSMGSWRMNPGSDRVYLECRDTTYCLANTAPQPGAAALIRYIGFRMRDLEKFIKKPQIDKKTLLLNRQSRSAKKARVDLKILNHKKKQNELKAQRKSQAQIHANGQMLVERPDAGSAAMLVDNAGTKSHDREAAAKKGKLMRSTADEEESGQE